MYTTFCSSIHLSIDIWVVIIFWLLWIMLLWTWVFKSLLPILLNIYLELEFLHHMVILCLISYTASSPFYSPISDTQGFQFLHIFANTSNVCEVISHRGLICTSLPVSDVKHLFMCLSAFVHLLCRNIYLSILPIFKSGCFNCC